jgi:lipoprotein-releasing system ATP-binding protein
MALIEATNINKFFGSLQVLKGISVSIQPGEIVTIVGASGAGKTTFLQIAGTLMKPSGGSVFINGTEVSNLRDNELARFRNKHIGFVFQFHHLLPEFSAIENVCITAFI